METEDDSVRVKHIVKEHERKTTEIMEEQVKEKQEVKEQPTEGPVNKAISTTALFTLATVVLCFALYVCMPSLLYGWV